MGEQEIGLRIRKIRTARGISQMKLAESVGVSFQQIQKYESGVNKVSIEKLKKIAYALNTPIEFFIGVEKKPGKKKVAEEKAQKYAEIGFEELSTEEIQLLLRFRAIENDDVKEGINLLLKGIERAMKHKAL